MIADLADDVRRFARNSLSVNTRRGYESDWQQFVSWCSRVGFASLPASADSVCLFAAHLAKTVKVGTIERKMTSIAKGHTLAGYGSPTNDARVRATMAGLRRTLGKAQSQKSPTAVADLRRMSEAMPDSLIGVRDRCLLLLGFAAAFRRSELVSLDVADVTTCPEGLVLHLRRSKTDQEGEGRKIGVPYGSNLATCPVRAFTTWLEASAIEAGALFRPIDRRGHMSDRRLSDRAVALVVKRSAERIGLDPAKYAGHSLRIGLATAAARAGASERSIMRQTGHRSVVMVRRYIQDGTVFTENAASVIGL